MRMDLIASLVLRPMFAEDAFNLVYRHPTIQQLALEVDFLTVAGELAQLLADRRDDTGHSED